MLDRDLAQLYDVPTGVLNQAVKRHANRFPVDFMFQLDIKEMANWKSQIVISNSSLRMGLRRRPFVFTEQGVAMLSSVLNSERAAMVNVEIMRVFVRLREMALTHKDLAQRLDELERKYNRRFKLVFEAIRELLEPSVPPKPKIGFRTKDVESKS